MQLQTTVRASASTFAFFCLCIGLVRESHSQETTIKPTTKINWAIAIHGGAGSSPSQLGEDSSKKRTEGLQKALQSGRDLLASGGSAMDAVEAVIRILEDDPIFNAGRGAVVTADGRVELDASIMDGKTLGCGAVAGVTNVKNPISLARRVMSETKHVLLVGPGAEKFAETQQVQLVDPAYFITEHNAIIENSVVRARRDTDPKHLGTVGCVALDSQGNLAAGTSTGGTANKLPGRVGDSPIVGAGTYASNGLCAVSGTGVGEEFIRNSVAYDIAAQLRYAGTSLASSVTEVMTKRLKPGIGGLISVSQNGEIVMQHNTPGMSCGAADSTGRFQTYLMLENGGVFPTTESNSTIAEITKLLHQQASDWNAGDIDAFMRVYWKSDQLTFSSGGEVTRGFDATLARYKVRYPTPDAMGKLTFTDLEFLPLGEMAIQVLGVWKLDRKEPMGGRFTLVFQRFTEGWRIVHDHTSKFAETLSP